MFKQKTKSRLKRTLSGALALAMTASVATVMPAAAEETATYPYAVFAADGDAGITVNTDSFTLNGNAYTNGVFSATAQYPNINGTITDADDIIDEEIKEVFDVNKDMILIHTKLTSKYFTEGCDTYDEDYTYSDMNVNINAPIYVTGKLNLDGNISLNNAVGAVSDVDLTGGNLNGNNTVIYSKFGDIDISNSQASVNGLIYAPFGTVTIDCDSFNMNGLIIAQNVVIDGYGANINYNSSWAELVGTESEELSWTMDDWQYLADTDEDGLPNLIEKEIGSDPYNPDTDGDELPDGYEVLTLGTDPTKPDTDDNGLLDCDEDFDEDGLTNLQEYEQGTEPYNDDTDGDGLKDGEEINTYGTDPLKVDTDEDGLDDGDEIYFETDLLNPDTDGNGVLDGDEKRFQTFIHKVENEDCAVTEVRVSMEGTGNLQKTTTIESIMNKDILCSEVVGLVGEPFSIETTSQFDKATLTYVIDKSKLGDTEFDNLLFLWYDEENDNFVELDTVLDEENSTVTVETTHFSKYMLVDQVEWFNAWKNAPDYFGTGSYVPYDTVIAIDCSGSMFTYDPWFDYYYDEYHNFSRRVTYRQLACEQYAAAMIGGDRTAIVTFDDYAQKRTGLTDKTTDITNAAEKYIRNGGGTDFNSAINASLNILSSQSDNNHNKSIILLSDGYPSYQVNAQLISTARNRGIKIYTVGLGENSSDTILKNIARDTNGEFFKAVTAKELENIYYDISYEQYLDIDWKDNDEDGIPDEFEASGLICSNGNIYYTEYGDIETGHDTDDDGLVDGEEIIIDYGQKHIPAVNSPYADFISSVYFTYRSDPLDEDTDGDGTKDNKDPLPNSYGISNRLNISDKNQLLSEIDSQIRSDVEWHKWLAQLPYNGVSECIDIIYDYDEIITDLSNAYMIPKPAIQSVLLRELKCLWAQDDFADSAVLSYYLYKHQLEDYHNWSKLEQLLLGPPEAPLLMREDSSTGYGQIFASTAINANNWAIDEGIISGNKYDYDDWHQREEIWDKLRTNNEYNISMIPLVLMHGAFKKGFERNYYDYTVAQTKKMLAVYNGDDIYGEAVYHSYVIFEKYN